MGWWPDLPDLRDFTPEDERIVTLTRVLGGTVASAPATRLVDLRLDLDGDDTWPVEDQDGMNTSSAFAVLGMVEYLERRATGRAMEPSKLYLYQMARKILRLRDDTGVSLRSTFKAMTRFGVPPRDLWPYEPARVNMEPTDLCLTGYARDYEPIRYVQIAPYIASGEATLNAIKSFLAAGFPVAFGFSVPHSLSTNPDIPYRPTFDSVRGGQAALAFGYDDQHLSSAVGALLIRCSWGDGWGDHGYGWLPYAYVEQRLATDWWSIVNRSWLQSGEFRNPATFAPRSGWKERRGRREK